MSAEPQEITDQRAEPRCQTLRSDGEGLFAKVCQSADVESCVAAMQAAELRSLAAYLHHATTGVPALVAGLVDLEAARRYLSS